MLWLWLVLFVLAPSLAYALLSHSFSFRTVAASATEDLRVTQIVSRLDGGLTLAWDAGKAVRPARTPTQAPAVKAAGARILPPEAKASVVLECAGPVLVDEFFPLKLVAAANDDTVQQGAVSVTPAPADTTSARILTMELAPAPADGVSSLCPFPPEGRV